MRLEEGATCLDAMTDRTAAPAWSAIASEIDRIAVQLREIAAGHASRVTFASSVP